MGKSNLFEMEKFRKSPSCNTHAFNEWNELIIMHLQFIQHYVAGCRDFVAQIVYGMYRNAKNMTFPYRRTHFK